MKSLRLEKTSKLLGPTINLTLAGLTEINPVLVTFQQNPCLSASKFKIKFHGHSALPFGIYEIKILLYCCKDTPSLLCVFIKPRVTNQMSR